jgi:hypothetical protein
MMELFLPMRSPGTKGSHGGGEKNEGYGIAPISRFRALECQQKYSVRLAWRTRHFTVTNPSLSQPPGKKEVLRMPGFGGTGGFVVNSFICRVREGYWCAGFGILSCGSQ